MEIIGFISFTLFVFALQDWHKSKMTKEKDCQYQFHHMYGGGITCPSCGR